MSRSSRPKVSINAPKRSNVDARTRFYIDYSWWEESSLNLETHLATRLGHPISLDEDGIQVDLIDPYTGEVRQLSGFEFAVQSYFQELPADFVTKASLVDAAFCVLLANGNRPMAATEIAEKIQRSSDVVYKTLGGDKVYQGIRVHQE